MQFEGNVSDLYILSLIIAGALTRAAMRSIGISREPVPKSGRQPFERPQGLRALSGSKSVEVSRSFNPNPRLGWECAKIRYNWRVGCILSGHPRARKKKIAERAAVPN